MKAIRSGFNKMRGAGSSAAAADKKPGAAKRRWDVPDGPPPDGSPFAASKLEFVFRHPVEDRFHLQKRELLTFFKDGQLTLRVDSTFYMADRNATAISLEKGHYFVNKPARKLRAAWTVRCAVSEKQETRSRLTGPGTASESRAYRTPRKFACSLSADGKSCHVADGNGARTFVSRSKR